MSTKYTKFLFITKEMELGKRIAKDLWQRCKSWCVVSTDNIYDISIKSFLKNDDFKAMIVTKPDIILSKKVNYFVKFCEDHNILPIFITKKTDYKEDITHTMYVNLEEVLEDSLEYIHNDDIDPEHLKSENDNIDEYTYMLNILTEYLW